MTLTIDLTPDETKRFEAAGIDLTRLLKSIAASLPAKSPTPTESPVPTLDPKSIAAMEYLQEKINRALTDPEEIRKAEAEAADLQQRLNENRIAAGETPLFPE